MELPFILQWNLQATNDRVCYAASCFTILLVILYTNQTGKYRPLWHCVQHLVSFAQFIKKHSVVGPAVWVKHRSVSCIVLDDTQAFCSSIRWVSTEKAGFVCLSAPYSDWDGWRYAQVMTNALSVCHWSHRDSPRPLHYTTSLIFTLCQHNDQMSCKRTPCNLFSLCLRTNLSIPILCYFAKKLLI